MLHLFNQIKNFSHRNFWVWGYQWNKLSTVVRPPDILCPQRSFREMLIFNIKLQVKNTCDHVTFSESKLHAVSLKQSFYSESDSLPSVWQQVFEKNLRYWTLNPEVNNVVFVITPLTLNISGTLSVRDSEKQNVKMVRFSGRWLLVIGKIVNLTTVNQYSRGKVFDHNSVCMSVHQYEALK